MNVQEQYEQALSSQGFQPDAAQQRAVERLQRADEEWEEFNQPQTPFSKRWFKRWFEPDPTPRGVYLWGRGRARQIFFNG